MIILGLDTETTGVDQPGGDRIIEIAMLAYDSNTRTLVDQYVQRIDPERSINPKAQAVHGISLAELRGQPKWEEVAPHVARRLFGADYVVAHNKAFDLPFVAGELIRIGQPLKDVDTFCTMENARWATMDGKSPKLMELCFALGVDYNPMLAHAAEYDVDRMMACFWRALDRGFFQLPGLTMARAA